MDGIYISNHQYYKSIAEAMLKRKNCDTFPLRIMASPPTLFHFDLGCRHDKYSTHLQASKDIKRLTEERNAAMQVIYCDADDDGSDNSQEGDTVWINGT